ncbi:MAG: hypothetical protein IKJ35_03665 [Clostridia bacterium]|nr:hypothetical protein [Clostridia bacterium]
MAKQKSKRIEKTVIFNRGILLFVIVFIALLWFSISLFKAGDKELGGVLLGVSVFISLGIFFTPLCFVFTKNEITVIWLFQYKRIIPWNAIKSIIELKWGGTYKDLPRYELIYHLNYKGLTISKQFDIPKNKKTKKVIEQYAKYKIV